MKAIRARDPRTREAMELRASGMTFAQVGTAVLGHRYMLRRGQPMEPITANRAHQIVVRGWESVIKARRNASRRWFAERDLPLFPIGSRECLAGGNHCPSVETGYFRRLAMRYASQRSA